MVLTVSVLPDFPPGRMAYGNSAYSLPCYPLRGDPLLVYTRPACSSARLLCATTYGIAGSLAGEQDGLLRSAPQQDNQFRFRPWPLFNFPVLVHVAPLSQPSCPIFKFRRLSALPPRIKLQGAAAIVNISMNSLSIKACSSVCNYLIRSIQSFTSQPRSPSSSQPIWYAIACVTSH